MHGNKIDYHRETSQKNLFAGELYKVKLYIIIMKLEYQKKGVSIKAPILNKEIKRTIIAFIDDTSFYLNEFDYNTKI